MTTFEHAMLGVTQVLSTGLNRRHGWQLVAMAAVVAISPDWDGLTFIGGVAALDRAHRVWGHNLLVCAAVGAMLAALDYRWDLVSRAKQAADRLFSAGGTGTAVRRQSPRTARGYGVWVLVGIVVALSHLPADLVFSGGQGVTDWPLQLYWPFSDREFVYPRVPWGDIGTTVIFAAAMFAMWRWPRRLQAIAAATLAMVIFYIFVRGMLR